VKSSRGAERWQDGSAHPGAAAAAAVRAAADGALIALYEDISDRKAAEAAMRAARDLAERVAQARRAFLANMSHETSREAVPRVEHKRPHRDWPADLVAHVGQERAAGLGPRAPPGRAPLGMALPLPCGSLMSSYSAMSAPSGGGPYGGADSPHLDALTVLAHSLSSTRTTSTAPPPRLESFDSERRASGTIRASMPARRRQPRRTRKSVSIRAFTSDGAPLVQHRMATGVLAIRASR